MSDEMLVIGQCPECREINRHADNCKVPVMRAFNRAVLARTRPANASEQHGETKKTIMPARNRPEDRAGIPDALAASLGFPRNSTELPPLESVTDIASVAHILVECLNAPKPILHSVATLLDEYSLLLPERSTQRFTYAELAAIIKMVIHRRKL